MVDAAPAFGCLRCFGADPAAAWQAMQQHRLGFMLQESHVSVGFRACACGQRFAIVFTERIDWEGGEDDQLWLALPVSPEEQARVEAGGEARVASTLAELGRERRFLVRSFPTGGSLELWWRQGGFAIGPHD